MSINVRQADVVKWYKGQESVQDDYSSINAVYNTASSAVPTATAYNISSAYSAYRKNQLRIENAKNLETGYKNTLSESNYNDFVDTKSDIETTASDTLIDIETARNTALSSYSSNLEDKFENTSTIWNSILDYYNTTFNTAENETWFEEITAGNAQSKGLYTLNTNGEFEITDKGKAFYNFALNTSDSVGGSLGDYFYTKKLTDAGDEYANNAQLYKDMLIGDGEITRSWQDYAAEDVLKEAKVDTSVTAKFTDADVTDSSQGLLNKEKDINSYSITLSDGTTKTGKVLYMGKDKDGKMRESLTNEYGIQILNGSLKKGAIITNEGKRYMYNGEGKNVWGADSIKLTNSEGEDVRVRPVWIELK